MIKILTTTLILLTSFITQAVTPDTKNTTEQFDDWILVCNENQDNKACHATQKIANKQGQLVSTLNILKSANNKNIIEVVLPLMLDLTVPVAIQVDDKKLEHHPYSLCNGQACFVLINGEAPLIQKMKQGLVIKVQAKPATQQDYLTLQFSLKGLSRAIKALDEALNKN